MMFIYVIKKYKAGLYFINLYWPQIKAIKLDTVIGKKDNSFTLKNVFVLKDRFKNEGLKLEKKICDPGNVSESGLWVSERL